YSEARARIDAALSGSTVSHQSELHDRSGGARCLEVSYLPQRDENGEVLGVVMLLSDLTEQRQLERSRIKSEAQSHRLLKYTAAIAEAVTPEQVFEAVVDDAGAALNASTAGLWLVPEDGRTTRLTRSQGYTDEVRARFDGLPVDASLRFPALDAFRDGNAI